MFIPAFSVQDAHLIIAFLFSVIFKSQAAAWDAVPGVPSPLGKNPFFFYYTI